MAVNCPAGKYCPSGTSANQNVCPKGYYCPANSRHPTPCPKGNYCPAGASAPTQCEAGFYCPDLASQHTPCTPGFYCPAGAFTQLICSGNTFSAAQASVCSCISPPHGIATGTATDCIITCDPGFAPYMGQCIPSMKPGQLTYLNADGTPSAVATQKIAYACPPCYSLQGSLCSFNGTCNPTCPNGYIVNQYSMCTQCPAGKQSRNNQCVDADAGYYASLGVEIACPPGTYSAPGANACTLCPTGTASAVIGASSCTPCSIGTYSDSLGAKSCTPCAQGTYSTSTGRTTACTTQCSTWCPQPAQNYVSTACRAWSDIECSRCSSPSTSQYVTAVCRGSTNTQFSTFPSCNPGYYLSGEASGAYNTLGSSGSCLPCANPSGVSQYVFSVCTATTNTMLATPNCRPGYYIRGLIAGAYNSIGSSGTCTVCSSPSASQYVTAVCSATTDTQFSTSPSCNQGYYFGGRVSGSFQTLGSQGSCFFGTKPTCAAGQFISSSGTCTPCSSPFRGQQYVTAICTEYSNTELSPRPTCQGYYSLSGFKPGTYSTLGSSGTCTPMDRAPSFGGY